MKREGEPIKCLVPHCRGRSWRYKDSREYLCSRHYPMADAEWRSRHRTNCRLIDNAHREGCQATMLYNQNAIIWQAIRRQALERAHAAPIEPKEEEESTPPLRRHVRAPKHKPDF